MVSLDEKCGGLEECKFKVGEVDYYKLGYYR